MISPIPAEQSYCTSCTRPLLVYTHFYCLLVAQFLFFLINLFIPFSSLIKLLSPRYIHDPLGLTAGVTVAFTLWSARLPRTIGRHIQGRLYTARDSRLQTHQLSSPGSPSACPSAAQFKLAPKARAKINSHRPGGSFKFGRRIIRRPLQSTSWLPQTKRSSSHRKHRLLDKQHMLDLQ
jgi:hypothetical protein